MKGSKEMQRYLDAANEDAKMKPLKPIDGKFAGVNVGGGAFMVPKGKGK